VIGNGMAMAICKDMDFPRTIRSDAQAGIRLMATPANDFVLDDWMHARQSIMRGVENGFAVARSATNGIETISDARGQVLARARVASSGLTAIRAEVPLGPGMTPYVRFGDVFAWVAVVATVGLGAAAVAGWRRSSTWIVAERSNG
jgi:apolipoprotein N-acyltransferase